MVNLSWSNPLPTPQFASLSILLQLDIPKQFSTQSSSNNSDNDDGDSTNQSGNKVIRSVSSGELSSLAPDNSNNNNLQVSTVTVHLPNNEGTKEVPFYPKGLVVNYLKQITPAYTDDNDDNVPPETPTVISTPATILEVHQDDNLEPYYTIRLHSTGVEKQTDNAHLGQIQRQKESSSSSSSSLASSNDVVENGSNTAIPPQQQAKSHAVLRETMTVITPYTVLSENSHLEFMEGLHVDIMEEYGLRDDFMGVGRSNFEHETNNTENGSDDEEEFERKDSKVRFGHGTKEAAAATSGGGDERKGIDAYFGNLPIRIYKPRHSLLGMTLYYLAVYADDIPKLIEDADTKEEEHLKKLFQHCASVLVPGVSLSSKDQRGGVIVLTVGSTGAAYDLFGASSVIATLPQRLRDCMKQLALVDTTPKEVLLTNDEVQRQLRQQLPEKDGSRRFPFLSKSTTNRSTQQQKLLQELSKSAPTTTKYDAAYFHRLYMALLATILDDEDGFMREHDDVVIQSYPFSPQSSVKASQSPAISRENGGTLKKNRFTFSRRKVKNDQQYAFGSGDNTAISEFHKDEKEEAEDNSTKIADIILREVQKLEVLSIAEDDMPIPRYSRLVGENKKSASPRGRKSPRKGGMAAAASGRFGRPAVHSDLSGFEYRPSAQQRMLGVGGSVSGFTSSTSEVSEDVSIMTGDMTAFTTSTQSSVPTLSRSKRDDSSSSSSSSRSRRFMFMKKKKEKSPKRKKGTPLSSIPQDQELQQTVYDPFGYDDDEVNVNNSNTGKGALLSSINTKSAPVDLDDTPPESPQVAIVNELNRSYSYESEEKESDASAPETLPESIEELIPEPEPEPEPEPTRHLDVTLALNEDLTCEYKQSKLSTLTVEGTIQVRMSLSYDGGPPKETPSSIPFNISFKDPSGHVRTLQENKKFVDNISSEREAANREFTYAITIPREEEYFPVVRYKCDTSLRPVPIRVQSRVRTQGKLCRVALQISSNPQNPSDLVNLTVIMGVPPGLNGESLKCNPPGGVWNESKRVVIWCVSELGGGEKFQLQAIFEMSDDLLRSGVDPAGRLEFPVMARCQCVGAQLSDVVLDVSEDDTFPAAVSKNCLRRYRVSHKEKK